MTSPKDSGIAAGVQQESPDEVPMMLDLDEFSERTQHLTTEQVGALFLAMAHIHQADGELPLDHSAFAKIFRLDPDGQDYADIWRAISPLLDVRPAQGVVRISRDLVQ